MSVCVLIRLPCDIFDHLRVFGHIRSQDLPVEASILDSDLALELFHEMLSYMAGAREKGLAHLGLLENMLGYWTVRV